MARTSVQRAQPVIEEVPEPMDRVIAGDAQALSSQLQTLRAKLYPPEARKQLRRFTSGEAAKLIGVTDSYLRHLALGGGGPEPGKKAAGPLAHRLEQTHEIRRVLSIAKPAYLPIRENSNHLQTIAVTNFKGGS